MNPESPSDIDNDQLIASIAQYGPFEASAETTPNSGKLPPELQLKHDQSVENYPDIQFLSTEYVIIDVQRTIWGLVLIWLVAIVAFAVILLFAATIIAVAQVDPLVMFTIVVASGIICLVGGAVGQYVFHQNFFIVTNKRVFARIQNSPFAYHLQNIDLRHIEDCSYFKNGLLQMLFDVGTIRLSTISDEQTYLFTFVARPTEQFKIVNQVVQTVHKSRGLR
ncbi:hypothetical protein FWH58_00585 [Candidatus Saccharibacteria bacterium]|nr:hypothetical protein [Candidatus Saccharibacteria bacterium]